MVHYRQQTSSIPPYKGVNNQRSKYGTQTQQQRPESPTICRRLASHACEYKVHKLHQRYILYTRGASSTPEVHLLHQRCIFYTRGASSTLEVHLLHQRCILYTRGASSTPEVHPLHPTPKVHLLHHRCILYTRGASSTPEVHLLHQRCILYTRGASSTPEVHPLPQRCIFHTRGASSTPEVHLLHQRYILYTRGTSSTAEVHPQRHIHRYHPARCLRTSLQRLNKTKKKKMKKEFQPASACELLQVISAETVAQMTLHRLLRTPTE